MQRLGKRVQRKGEIRSSLCGDAKCVALNAFPLAYLPGAAVLGCVRKVRDHLVDEFWIEREARVREI